MKKIGTGGRFTTAVGSNRQLIDGQRSNCKNRRLEQSVGKSQTSSLRMESAMWEFAGAPESAKKKKEEH